jgi:hypothetical protein
VIADACASGLVCTVMVVALLVAALLMVIGRQQGGVQA